MSDTPKEDHLVALIADLADLLSGMMGPYEKSLDPEIGFNPFGQAQETLTQLYRRLNTVKTTPASFREQIRVAINEWVVEANKKSLS
jgi:hypothetical protein